MGSCILAFTIPVTEEFTSSLRGDLREQSISLLIKPCQAETTNQNLMFLGIPNCINAYVNPRLGKEPSYIVSVTVSIESAETDRFVPASHFF